jgi:hypothetical protein
MRARDRATARILGGETPGGQGETMERTPRTRRAGPPVRSNAAGKSQADRPPGWIGVQKRGVALSRAPAWLWLLGLVPAALAVSGCNVACQTYCDNITDFYHGCVVPEDGAAQDDITWQNLGADDAEAYWTQCHERFERTLVIARVQDRNAIYDWCTEASMAVAGAPNCDDLELPEPLDLLNQEPGDEEDE